MKEYYYKNKRKILSILFILTLITPIIAVTTLVKYADVNDKIGKGILGHYDSYSLILLFFLPLSLICFILGFINKKERFALKNIIIGLIVSMLLIWFSLIPALFFNNDSYDYKNIFNYEKILDIDLPQDGYITKYNYKDNLFYKNDIKSNITVYYKNVDTSRLENSIINNSKWMLSSNINYEDLKVLYNSFYYKNDNLYILVYNETLNEYNKQPTEKGNYNFLIVTYRFKNKLLHIFEYNYKFE